MKLKPKWELSNPLKGLREYFNEQPGDGPKAPNIYLPPAPPKQKRATISPRSLLSVVTADMSVRKQVFKKDKVSTCQNVPGHLHNRKSRNNQHAPQRDGLVH